MIPGEHLILVLDRCNLLFAKISTGFHERGFILTDKTLYLQQSVCVTATGLEPTTT